MIRKSFIRISRLRFCELKEKEEKYDRLKKKYKRLKINNQTLLNGIKYFQDVLRRFNGGDSV